MRREAFTREVAIKTPTFVEAEQVPLIFHLSGKKWFGATEKGSREFDIIEDQPAVIADALVHDRARSGGDGGLFVAGLLALRDELPAFVGGKEIVDDEDDIAVERFFVHGEPSGREQF